MIAHEFSHILNGDMRLNQQLMGLSFGILALAQIGRWLLRSVRVRSGRRSNGAAMMGLAIGVTLMVIGSIGLFFSRLIKAGVSRQREMLADASAVQFTRDRVGLADALKKIGGIPAGSKIKSPNGPEASHMYFGRGIGAPVQGQPDPDTGGDSEQHECRRAHTQASEDPQVEQILRM